MDDLNNVFAALHPGPARLRIMDVGGSSGISTVEWQDGGHSYDAMDYIRDPCPGRATRYFVIDMMFARDSKLATGATLIADDQIPD